MECKQVSIAAQLAPTERLRAELRPQVQTRGRENGDRGRKRLEERAVTRPQTPLEREGGGGLQQLPLAPTPQPSQLPMLASGSRSSRACSPPPLTPPRAPSCSAWVPVGRTARASSLHLGELVHGACCIEPGLAARAWTPVIGMHTTRRPPLLDLPFTQATTSYTTKR